MNRKEHAFLKWIALFVAGGFLMSCATPATPSATAIETPASGPFAKTFPASPPLGSLVEETEHCTIYYPEGDEASASFIGIVLEDNLDRISADLGYRSPAKLKISIYPDLETFHQAIDLPDAPEWIVAAGYAGGIQIVTPRLIWAYPLEKTIVHELTHALQGEINPQAPFWMVEGLAMYESGMFEGVEETVRQGIEEDKIPSLDSLETFATDEEFAQAGGYAFGYMVVEYAVQTYGKEVLAKWVKTPQEYERVFGVDKETFEKQWLAYMVDLYDMTKQRSKANGQVLCEFSPNPYLGSELDS